MHYVINRKGDNWCGKLEKDASACQLVDGWIFGLRNSQLYFPISTFLLFKYKIMDYRDLNLVIATSQVNIPI